VNLELLRSLCDTPGISGFEDDVQSLVADALGASCDEVRRDRLGNVIGLKRATTVPAGAERALRVVLAAHADEIGLLVQHVDERGFVHFAAVGGIQAGASASQHVTIHGRRPVRGVIVPAVGRHESTVSLDELQIDLGLPVERVRELVEVGDPITYTQELVQLNDKVYAARNFDDRLGTYCLLEAMSRVGDVQVDVYAVSTVQEELGVRGMPVAAHAIEPDVGIAIDGSICRGAGPWATPHERTCELGGGTGIYVMDRLTMGDRRLVASLIELCREHGIAFQRNLGGGTDASAMQRSGDGALATTIGAPVRYMHSTVGLCHDDDVEATIALLVAFLEHAHDLVT
jgi:putative aminopeptidase FrvX